jgi:hypothetical protein
MGTLTDGGSHGWGAYGAALAAMLVALLLPVVLHFAGRLFGLWSGVESAGDEAAPRPRQIPPNETLNTRYFSSVMMGGLIAMPVFMLLPLIGGNALLGAVSVIVCIGAGLVYANRKRDLRWSDTLAPEAGASVPAADRPDRGAQ